jgi:hypothetical protein
MRNFIGYFWIVSDLKRRGRDSDTSVGSANNCDIHGIEAGEGHNRATVATAAAVLNFAQKPAIRCVGKQTRGRVGAARFDQHLAGGSIVVTFGDLDSVHVGGATATTSAAARSVSTRGER